MKSQKVWTKKLLILGCCVVVEWCDGWGWVDNGGVAGVGRGAGRMVKVVVVEGVSGKWLLGFCPHSNL
jgi:hypothetical protein